MSNLVQLYINVPRSNVRRIHTHSWFVQRAAARRAMMYAGTLDYVQRILSVFFHGGTAKRSAVPSAEIILIALKYDDRNLSLDYYT